MATTNALIKAIGNELINTSGKELVNQGAKQVAGSALSHVLPQVATKAVNKAIPVTAQKSILQNIPINTNNQIKLFRGINAETPELLQQYIGDMMDTSIKPRTYGNGGAYGEGYYFTPYKDVAEGYATNDLNKPYQAILEINPNKGRFLGINKANKNRPVDFVIRAEDRGVPGGRSGSVGEKDFEKYLNRNGILGNKASDEVYVVKDNSALNGMKVVGRRGPDKVWDYSEEVLPEKIKEIGADKYLGSPTVGVDINTVNRVEPYLGDRITDKSGNPVTFYHSTPNDFSKFDDSRLGENTNYDNTALGHFVTTDKDFSKRFIDVDNVGKTGKTMELQARVKNPIIHPYLANSKYPEEQLDDILIRWINATSADEETANQIIQDYKDLADYAREFAEENGEEYNSKSPLWDAYMEQTFTDDMNPYEYAADDRNALMKNGYDAVEIVEGAKKDLVDGSIDETPISSYAVLSGENLRNVRHIPVEQQSGESIDFSKSKIKDKKGNLLKLYHGTDADFSEFGDVKTEPGYWFTEDKNYALSHGKNLKTVNLNMVKPLDVTTLNGNNKMWEYAKDCFGTENVSEDDIMSNRFRDYLIDKGYDGIIFDHSGKNTYIAFSPEQIKILD